MLGDPDSCGIWAPCLTLRRRPVLADLHRREALRPHHAGRRSGASLRDMHNYLVTSPRIDGEWSDPVYLNSSGFDPSLFHDDDGRKYLREHAVGSSARVTIASPASCCRNTRAAERKLIGERTTDLQRHADRLHRRAASLQARRLLLPADGRRRHGLGPRGHDGALAQADRVRTNCIRTRTS